MRGTDAIEAVLCACGDLRRQFVERPRSFFDPLMALNANGATQVSQEGDALYRSARAWIILLLVGMATRSAAVAWLITRASPGGLSPRPADC